MKRKKKVVITCSDLLKHYWPGMTDEEIDYFMWELTPYPFCSPKYLEDFVFEVYRGQLNNLGLTPHKEQNNRPCQKCNN